MAEISMGGVNFNDAEPGFAGPACGRGKPSDDLLNALVSERLRRGIVVGERYRARGHNFLPASRAFRDASVSLPRSTGTRLASRMRQLHSSNTALPTNEAYDSRQEFNMVVLPDAQVLRADAALGEDRCRFRKDESSSPNGPAAKMHQVPVIGVSITAGVLAHR